MKPIIFDTETTGTDHQTDQIIEAAWLELPERPYQFASIAPAPLAMMTRIEDFLLVVDSDSPVGHTRCSRNGGNSTLSSSGRPEKRTLLARQKRNALRA
ncbi:hypothetical protein [Pseudomonas aeruginosa]|uniref:hypothetical protein n=1 Tax=Pseudomonas aeruginosa TaxID=287 RepID=UPI0015DB4D92|nr:hypothetical protein [Pseudomonas aeruginosa]HDQ4745542.1 hypothetical protein [Pseudomonas aeruginosa]